MKRNLHDVTLAVASLFLVMIGFSNAELKVVEDRLNILSHRVSGKWILNEELSKELWGKGELAEKGMRVIELKSDEMALKEFPQKLKDLLVEEGSKIYFAGWFIIGGSKYPSVLRQDHGNTCLTFLTPGGVDSINIMMAVGSSPKVDQLFAGGRYTSQETLPFYAYRRELKEARVQE